MQRGRDYGFTLIELIVTLVVLAILATLAAPSFASLIDKSRLRGATDDLVSLLNTARANAIKLQRDVNVSITGTTTWCAGAVNAPDPAAEGAPILSASKCDCTAASACTIAGNPAIVSSSTYSGAALSSVASQISGSGVVFNAKLGALDFSALPDDPLFTVASPSGKFKAQVSVSPLGQTRVCVPNGSPFVAGYSSC